MPHGRIYNAIECIANWTERAGEQIYNQLLERPAQMFGIMDIGHYRPEILFFNSMIMQFLLLIKGIVSKRVSEETLEWIILVNAFLIVGLFLFDLLLLSKKISRGMALLIRDINHCVFR